MSSIRILGSEAVDSILHSLSVNDHVDLMHRVFVTLALKDSKVVVCPPRTSLCAPHHVAFIMPSRIETVGGTGIKVVSSSQSAPGVGLPATTMVLNELTGAVEAIVNARQLTAVRNAAGSLLATELAGVEEPRHLVLFGSGAQVVHHAIIFLQFYNSISHCTIVNRSINYKVVNLVGRLKVKFQGISTDAIRLDDENKLKRVLGDADVVCCATASKQALFDERWLKPSAHLNLIGSYTHEMREVTPALIDQASLIIADSISACQAEAGELISTPVERLVELGDLCREGQTYQRVPDRRTVFKSVGVGVQDVAIARLVLSKAEEKNLGVLVPFD